MHTDSCEDVAARFSLYRQLCRRAEVSVLEVLCDEYDDLQPETEPAIERVGRGPAFGRSGAAAGGGVGGVALLSNQCGGAT